METGKPVVLVCAAGSAINTAVEPDALLHVWYPGAEGGTALANILFGDVSPSGKLPVTFYARAEDLPAFTDYSMQNRTYRYATDNVLFPFGYGLTYSEIVCTDVTYANGTACATVKNRGNRDTEDVLELYLKDYSEHAVKNTSLCGFQRIALRAGETRTVSIAIPETAFTAVDAAGNRKRFGNRFTLFAGTHQPDSCSDALCGNRCAHTELTF